MLKKRIAYTDFNDVKREEDFFFYLKKSEVLELNLSITGGLENMVNKIVDERDSYKIYELFKKIIKMAYGEKSDDGKRFVKQAPDGHLLADDFESTEACSELIIQLMQNPTEAAAFIKGILPQELQGNITASAEANKQ